MSHALTLGRAPAARPAPRSTPGATRCAARAVPADLRIPPSPFRVRVLYPRREPAWREAMRWSLLGLTASWVAGEVTLLLLGL
jgi:hypothetical protein